MDTLIFIIASAFLGTLVLGYLLEKIRTPWIFGALIVGFLLNYLGFSKFLTNSNTFMWVSNLGMYFLLFIIGFEIDTKEWFKQGKFIIKSTAFIIPFEAIFGAMFFHFFFHTNWYVSFVAALSFATVGEAILVPILDEFKLINTKFGNAIIGVGILDDVFEVLTLILVSTMITSVSHEVYNSLIALLGVFGLFIGMLTLTKMKKEVHIFKTPKIGMMLVVVISILFLFIAIGSIGDVSALGALLAGIGAKMFIPRNRTKFIEKEIKGISYGFFAPLFFLMVGATTDIHYILTAPMLVILAMVVSFLGKFIGSLIAGIKELGIRGAALFGTALSVRFSTSVVLTKMMLDYGIIPMSMYSVIITATAIFTLVIPELISIMLSKWRNEIASL